MSIVSVFLAALFIMLASLSGVIFVWKKLGKWVEAHLSYLVSFSMGVFLIVIYDLALEAFEVDISKFLFLLWALFGVVILEVSSRLIPQTHHHHELEHDHEHSHIDARRMLLGDAMHNIGDGIFLVPAFLVDVWFGVSTALAVFLHELVQELSEFFVLKEAGHSTKGALILNFAVSGTIFIGVFLSLYVFSFAQQFIGPLISFTAGGFFYVIIRDLLPNTVVCIQKHGSAYGHIIASILGLVMMFGIGFVL